MTLDIKTTDLELTPAIEEYIKKKFQSLDNLLKSFEEEGNIYVYFEIARTTKHHKSGEVFYAEANVDLLGEKVRVEKKEEDIRAAIDGVKDVLKREVRKIKEKKVGHKKDMKRPGKPKK